MVLLSLFLAIKFSLNSAYADCPGELATPPFFDRAASAALMSNVEVSSATLDTIYMTHATHCGYEVLQGSWNATGGSVYETYLDAKNLVTRPIETIENRLNNPLVQIAFALNPFTAPTTSSLIANRISNKFLANQNSLNKKHITIREAITRYFNSFEKSANQLYKDFDNIDPKVKAEMACQGLGYLVTNVGLAYFLDNIQVDSIPANLFNRLKQIPQFSEVFSTLKANSTEGLNTNAERIAGAAANPRNKLVFSAPDRTAVDTFIKAPAYDGSVTIPKNIHVSGSVSSLKISGVANFDTGSIRAQSKPMRQLIKHVKDLTFSESPAREREVGAVVIEYDDGTSKVLKFTSNKFGTISDEDMDKAYSLSGAVSDGPNVIRAVHIHTHPSPLNPRLDTGYLGPSPADFDYLSFLKKRLGARSGGNIEVEGIVLPACNSCGDLFFRYLEGGFEYTR